MKKLSALYFLAAIGAACGVIVISACYTLSTTAKSPQTNTAVNGMLYYLPIGKITIQGEFKPSGGDKKEAKLSMAGRGARADDGGGAATPGPATITAGELSITLTPEVEADEKAGEFYVTPQANYIYDDDNRVAVNAKQLLSNGNVTTEDKTADIVGAIASIAAEVPKLTTENLATPTPTPTPTPPPPFYFSFHPSCKDEVEFVNKQLGLRNGLSFSIEPAPTCDCKKAYSHVTRGSDLGSNGLLFRPARSYKISLSYPASSYAETKNVVVLLTTQQFLLPDVNRLYEVEYPRMPFVKKVKEIGFRDGMLTDFRQKVPSPILGFLGIPKAVLQAIVPVPGAGAASSSGSTSGTDNAAAAGKGGL